MWFCKTNWQTNEQTSEAAVITMRKKRPVLQLACYENLCTSFNHTAVTTAVTRLCSFTIVWMNVTALRVTGVSESENFCAHFLAMFSVDMRENKHDVVTFCFDINFVLHNLYSTSLRWLCTECLYCLPPSYRASWTKDWKSTCWYESGQHHFQPQSVWEGPTHRFLLLSRVQEDW